MQTENQNKKRLNKINTFFATLNLKNKKNETVVLFLQDGINSPLHIVYVVVVVFCDNYMINSIMIQLVSRTVVTTLLRVCAVCFAGVVDAEEGFAHTDGGRADLHQ